MTSTLRHGHPYGRKINCPERLGFLRRIMGWDVPRRHIRHIGPSVPRYHCRSLFFGNCRPLKPRLKLEHERRRYVALAKRINARRREERWEVA